MAKKAKKGSKEKASTIPFKTKSSAKFVSFSFGATIPTQAFGNVQPRIEVTAASYEDARDFAVPRIREIYEHFCDVRPVFLGKITETTKDVTAPAPKEEKKEAASSPSSTQAKEPSTESKGTPEKPKSEAVLKAEKAIGLAMSEDAINAIQDQIQRSVKIADEDKPALYTICLKKKKELKK